MDRLRRFPSAGSRVILTSGIAGIVERALGPTQGILRMGDGTRRAVEIDKVQRVEALPVAERAPFPTHVEQPSASPAVELDPPMHE